MDTEEEIIMYILKYISLSKLFVLYNCITVPILWQYMPFGLSCKAYSLEGILKLCSSAATISIIMLGPFLRVSSLNQWIFL